MKVRLSHFRCRCQGKRFLTPFSFEAAIPWRELTPVAPGPLTHWLVGMVRVVPAVGAASWAQPALPIPHPQSLGLLRFE